MAITYSTQAEKINAPQTYGVANASEQGGRIKSNFFQHTCESESTGSTIYLTKLPAGARVVNIRFACEDLGGTNGATLEFGDSSDTDRLVSAFDVSTAAIAMGNRVLRTPTTETPDIGFGYKYAADTWILATTATQALNTGKFWGTVDYIVS